ncbi:carbohydrate binding domain-containing protein [Aliiruegeria lutimaris]|uniref:carbohydrate binding domain-containing protein n=1 Tax=Aliiruegeria lutimaris TaxID=571298 RepID=UPI00147AF893|nr:carbohydrate binding domain-containing protein [Aliiruegeria lutimaris]
MAGLMLLAGLPRAAGAADDARELAHFVVGHDVVAPDVGPFSATIGAFGNGHFLMPGGGFEPMVFRTMFQASGGSADRILASAEMLSNSDSWQNGALDGAEVEILRIESGAFRSVRRSRIAQDGYRVAGWIPLGPGKVVPGGQTQALLSFPTWYRTGVPYYFTIRAVGADGSLSEPAEAAVARRELALPKSGNATRLIGLEPRSDATRERLPAPRGLRARELETGEIALHWEAVPGAAGYALYRSDVLPEAHRGAYLQLEEAGPPIREGDLVLLRTRFLRAEREKLLSNRIWDSGEPRRDFVPPLVPKWSDEAGGGDWRLVPHPADTPVPDAGQTHLRVTLGAKERFAIGRFNHSGLAQSWYPVLEPDRSYRFEVWMRGRTPQTVRFELTGFHASAKGGALEPIPFRLTPQWRRYSMDFSVPVVNPGRGAGRMEIVLTGPGEFDIDNFRVFRADAPYLALLPEDVERLAASGMAALRTHGFVRTGRSSYDLEQLTNPAGASSGTEGGNTLPQVLGEFTRLGVDPWLQIEPHLTEAEWIGLAEYLAAPYDPSLDDPARKPWAARRHANGQAVPWTENFKQITLEIGNETWNGLFAPWVFPQMQDAVDGQSYNAGEVYGLYQEYVLSILKRSPYWDALAPKTRTVLGGRAGLGDWAGFRYGADAARRSPGSDVLAHAGYIGGWENGAAPEAPTANGLFRVLTHVLQVSLPQAHKQIAAAARIGEARGQAPVMGMYEAGPGYVLDGLNGRRMSPEQTDAQERALKSKAAGTATLDSFLARARLGMRAQNFFLYGDGSHWSSHRRWQHGGQVLPAWELLALFNRVGTGDMLSVRTLAVPVADLPEEKGRQAVQAAPLVDAYATRSGDRVTLMLVSRRVPGLPDAHRDGGKRVMVDLPFKTTQRVTRISQSGQWNSDNLTSREVTLQHQDVPPVSALPHLEVADLPAGSTIFYVFEGVE